MSKILLATIHVFGDGTFYSVVSVGNDHTKYTRHSSGEWFNPKGDQCQEWEQEELEENYHEFVGNDILS